VALRSFLFAPGNHARRVEKALTLPADAVILDLEDAVAVTEKPATRELVVATFGKPRQGRLYVRVNAYGTEWCYADIVTIARSGLDGIILPKVETADQLRSIDWLLANLERERGLPAGEIDLIPIIETALGMSNIGTIAASGSRTQRLAFGAGDYTLDLGMVWSRDEAELLPARSAVVMASRAAGIEPPLDTVWADLRDAEGFARSAECAAALGFQGKMCIHPDQIVVTNAAFSPSAQQLSWAARVVSAFEEAEAKGLASIQLDGQFIDYPIVQRARQVITRGACADNVRGTV
jgi:citrate lyase subunit beta / citryl-CoA lyase